MAQTVGTRPTEITIDVLAGEPIDFTVPVLDEDNVVQDVDDWTATAEVRRYPGGPLLHTFTLDPLPAGINVTATSAETATWAAWSSPVARWELWAAAPAASSYPVATGRVIVRSPITEV